MIYFSEKVGGQTLFELRDQIQEMETIRNFTNLARPCIYKQAIIQSIHRIISLWHRSTQNFREMWVSFGYKQQNDREPQLGNPTHMNNGEDIAIGIF